MFGKKEEPKLMPMSGYPKNVLDIIKKNLTNNTPVYDVDWSQVKRISIDLISIRPSYPRPVPLEMHLESGTSSEYISAWKKGLGKFIVKDWTQMFKENGNVSNLSKYKFSPFISQNSDGEIIHCVALIRFIENDDYKKESELEDLEDYNAISFKYISSDNKEKMVSVIKVFEKYNNLPNESRLPEVSIISKGDDYYSLRELYSELMTITSQNNTVMDDGEGEKNVVELSIEKQKEFMDEESLF